MLPIHSILCPTDFSDPAKAALPVAEALARDYNAELILLHAAQPPIVGFGEGMVALVPGEFFEQARAQLRDLRVDPRVRVERLFAQASPADEILRVARERNVDMIVMGTHGWTGLVRLLMGSIAEQVVRKAPCPVLTVRLPMAEARAQAAPAVAGQAIGSA